MTQSLAQRGIRAFRGLNEGRVREALQQSNPGAGAGDLRTMAKFLKLMFDVAVELPEAARREIVLDKARVRKALIEAVHPESAIAAERVHIEDAGRVERSQGTGLGERLSLEEGREWLQAFAVKRPIEDWAGPVAGAGEIEDRFGVPRSTLNTWQKRGAVVGLLRGERKLAYPLDQFIDGRPIEGIGDVIRLAPDARSAWLWLRQTHGALQGQSPLDRLRVGDRVSVERAAECDFA